MILIAANQRAIYFFNGKPKRWLDPGTVSEWSLWGKVAIRIYDLDEVVTVLDPDLESMVPHGAGTPLHVGPNQVALIRANDLPFRVLCQGHYLLWQLRARVEAVILDIDDFIVAIPKEFAALLPSGKFLTHVFHPYERALVYVNGELRRQLGQGRYHFFTELGDINILKFDTRIRYTSLVGQEMISSDKVSIRLSLMIKYRVTDPEQAAHSTDDVHAAMYAEAQLIARRYVAGLTIDTLLERRNDTAQALLVPLQKRTELWGVEVQQIDVKDIILPGEMKTLLNRVIEAEKQAIANNILRKEETAATRSQANTAKLLENNPMLLRLKEMELLREISQKVKNITVVTNGADLSQALSSPALPKSSR
jgi:hypothetical protein